MREPRSPALGRTIVGGFYLTMGGVHLGLVSADAQVYRHFADQALLPYVRDLWHDVFMANPEAWGLAVMAGELLLGILLLSGGRAAVWGWYGVIAFHVALMVFGFGFWLWSAPALVLLVWLAHRDPVLAGHPLGQRRDVGGPGAAAAPDQLGAH